MFEINQTTKKEVKKVEKESDEKLTRYFEKKKREKSNHKYRVK